MSDLVLHVPRGALADEELSALAVLVLGVCHAGADASGVVRVSSREIGEALGRDRGLVTRYLQRLVKAGWLASEPARRGQRARLLVTGEKRRPVVTGVVTRGHRFPVADANLVTARGSGDNGSPEVVTTGHHSGSPPYTPPAGHHFDGDPPERDREGDRSSELEAIVARFRATAEAPPEDDRNPKPGKVLR